MSGKIPMPDEQLDPRLFFKPFPPGDPIPEIWSMIRDLRNPEILRDSVRIVLDAHIAVAKLQRQIEGKRIEGLTQLRDVVARGQG